MNSTNYCNCKQTTFRVVSFWWGRQLYKKAGLFFELFPEDMSPNSAIIHVGGVECDFPNKVTAQSKL